MGKIGQIQGQITQFRLTEFAKKSKVTCILYGPIYSQSFINVRLILHELLQYQHFGRMDGRRQNL